MAATLKTDALQWHEGMLLSPQHFQQTDVRNAELLSFHISQIAPFHWGVCHSKIDTALLVGSNLHFSELEAIMPDGLVISSYDNEGETLEVDLNKHKDVIAEGPTMVYLAVPKYQHGSANAIGDNPRYMPYKSGEVVDENSGLGAMQLPRVVPNAQLIVGAEPSSSYVFFPLCELTLQSNAYVLTHYVPPLLKVTLESGLYQKCNDIIRQLREKIAYISQKIMSRSLVAGSNEMENISKALTIGLLPFEAMLKSEAAHPYNIYVGLCTLAGQIAALDPGHIPPIFESYDHNQLKASYNRVFSYISQMITRVQEGFTIIPFDLEERTFSLFMKEGWVNKKIIIGLMARSEMSQSDLIKWAEECVIASEDFVEIAKDNRILGAERTIIEKDEALNLTPPIGAILISLDFKDEVIQTGKNLMIFNVSDTTKSRPKEIVLYLPKNK